MWSQQVLPKLRASRTRRRTSHVYKLYTPNPLFCYTNPAAFLHCINTSTLTDGIALNIKLVKKNSKIMDSAMKYGVCVTGDADSTSRGIMVEQP